jgi:hypothetical protein
MMLVLGHGCQRMEATRKWEPPEMCRLPHGHIRGPFLPARRDVLLRGAGNRDWNPVEETTNDCVSEEAAEPVVGCGCPIHFASYCVRRRVLCFTALHT